ncbi:MAG: S-adenosylmethionine decarboxylase [Patescibacteria group bacterium]|nr:S-adenosylmethionine decarboxylase [Patescibacteria group bacterium]
MNQDSHFGEHITIDGYGGNENKLNDKKLVFSVLNELPELLSMSKLSEPVVYHADGNDSKDPGGWSGFVVINESHISIHTFPKRGFVSADVYTCKNGMDLNFVENYFKKAFDLKDIESNFIKRGIKYPKENIY